MIIEDGRTGVAHESSCTDKHLEERGVRRLRVWKRTKVTTKLTSFSFFEIVEREITVGR